MYDTNFQNGIYSNIFKPQGKGKKRRDPDAEQGGHRDQTESLGTNFRLLPDHRELTHQPTKRCLKYSDVPLYPLNVQFAISRNNQIFKLDIFCIYARNPFVRSIAKTLE